MKTGSTSPTCSIFPLHPSPRVFIYSSCLYVATQDELKGVCLVSCLSLISEALLETTSGWFPEKLFNYLQTSTSGNIHAAFMLLNISRDALIIVADRAHQNWTVEDWSDESRFLLRHSDGLA